MRNILILSIISLFSAACQSTENRSETPAKTDTTLTADTTGAETTAYEEYYDNGRIKIKGQNVNGKREGKWESYYETGLRWSETTFRNGIKEGPTKTYFENGMMRYSGQYKNDKRTGIWKFYNEEGRLDKTLDLSTEVPDTP